MVLMVGNKNFNVFLFLGGVMVKILLFVYVGG